MKLGKLDALTVFNDRSTEGMLAWLYFQYLCNPGRVSSKQATNRVARLRILKLLDGLGEPGYNLNKHECCIIRNAIDLHIRSAPQSPNNALLEQYAGSIGGLTDEFNVDEVARRLFTGGFRGHFGDKDYQPVTPEGGMDEESAPLREFNVSFELVVKGVAPVEIAGHGKAADLKAALDRFNGTMASISDQLEDVMNEAVDGKWLGTYLVETKVKGIQER